MAVLKTLYDHTAAVYQQMVRYEDYQGNLRPALAAIRPLDGLDVVECGAGTGRVTRLLLPHVRRIRAFDLSSGMLKVALDQLQQTRTMHWTLAAADSRALPLPGSCADCVVEGWSFAQIVAWHRDTWRIEADQAVHEMRRVLRPEGTAILIETLGTGRTTPQAPAAWMREFYDYLEAVHGFSTTWIRTDYKFPSRAEADELLRFFFKDEQTDAIMIAAQVEPDGACIVPECTGLWYTSR